MPHFKIDGRLLLVAAGAALAGCSAVPHHAFTQYEVKRVEVRPISASDLALIQAKAAEAADAAAKVDAGGS